MCSDSLEKSSANCRTKSVLKITCYVKKDQKETQADAVDQACVAEPGDLDPTERRVNMALWDLKDQSG